MSWPITVNSATVRMEWQENIDCIDCIPLSHALKMVVEEEVEVKLAYQLRIIAVQLYKLSRAVNPKSITWGPEDLPFFILYTNRMYLDHAVGKSPISLAKLEDLYFATVGKLKDLLTNVNLRLNNDFNAATDPYLTRAQRARSGDSHHGSSNHRFTGSISAEDFRRLLDAQKAILFGEDMMLALEGALKKELAQKQQKNLASTSLSSTCHRPEDGRRTAAGLAKSRILTTDLLWPDGSPNVRHAVKFPPAIIVGTLREKYLLDAIRVAPDADKALVWLDCQQGGGLGLEREALAPPILATVLSETKKDVRSDGSAAVGKSSSGINPADSRNVKANEPGLTLSLNPPDQANPRCGRKKEQKSTLRTCNQEPMTTITGCSMQRCLPNSDDPWKLSSPAPSAPAAQTFARSCHPINTRTEIGVGTNHTFPEVGPESHDSSSSARIGGRVSGNRRRPSKHRAERMVREPTAGRTDCSSSMIKLHCCDLDSSCHVGQQFLYGLPVEEIMARLDLLRAQFGNYEQRGKFHVYKSSLSLSWERSVKRGPRYVMRAAFRRVFRLQPTMVR
ncbi:MAG: hypothetical protein Q9174_000085 [Haloplaca sp. 1 TL-2023]